MTSGPIDLERLIDAQELLSGGSQPWTFLAFSRNILNHEGVPEDLEAQEYIAAVQCEGVPVGIWIDTPTAGVAYAFIGPEQILTLDKTLTSFQESGRFPERYAEKLTERLLGTAEQFQ